MNTLTIEALVRHILTFVAGAGFFGSDDELTRVASAIAALIAFAWSWWEKRQRGAGTGRPPTPIGPAAAVLVLLGGWLMGAAALTGCTTTGGINLATVATPARIKAVTALGAYAGTKAAIADGRRAAIEESLAGIRAFRASGHTDLASVMEAVAAAGVPIFSDEGRVYIAAGTLIFGDLWDGTAGKVLASDQAQAVLDGLEQGMASALAAGQRSVGFAPGLDSLQAAAVATRPTRK